MTTTPKMLPAGLYAIQTHDTTHIMVKVDGDKPLCLATYSRAVMEEADSITCFLVGGTPKPGNILGVSIMIPPEPGVLQAAEANGKGTPDQPNDPRTPPLPSTPNRKARRAAAKRK